MDPWKRRSIHILLAGCAALIAVLAVWGALEGNTMADSSFSAPAPVQIANGQPTLTVAGPDVAWLGEVVTYNVHFTGSLTGLEIYYLFPSHFTVIRTDPVTSSSSPGVLRWVSGQLSGRNTLTVTGQYGLGGCSPAVHTSGFFDPYNSQLPTASKVTSISNLQCAFLPVTLRTYSAGR
jgi:hypothetical protein